MTSELEQLKELQKMLTEGILSRDEFDGLKAKLLSQSFAAAAASSSAHHSAETSLAVREGDELGPTDQRFRLESRIGGGGMGEVWRALDLSESERMGEAEYRALKILPAELTRSPKHLEVLQREANVAAKLSHPHIINVYGLRQGRENIPFIVMECLEGKDLEAAIINSGDEGLPWHQGHRLAGAGRHGPGVRLGRVQTDPPRLETRQPLHHQKQQAKTD